MNVTLNIETDFSPQEVCEAIRSALEHEKHVAKYKVKRYSIICEDFEAKFGYSSSELKARFETGNMGETVISSTGMRQKGDSTTGTKGLRSFQGFPCES